MLTSKEIGKLFKDERERQGITVDGACLGSRIHTNVIKDIENGTFDRIGKVYLKSFMKKYSDFLGMDTAKVMSEFEGVLSELPVKEFSLETEDPQEKSEPFKLNIDLDGRMRTILLWGLGVIIVIILFVFISSRRSGRAETSTNVKVESRTHGAVPEKKKKTVKSKASGNVVLTLKARGEVWLQVRSEEGTVLFAGVLDENETKTFQYPGILLIWTGKAENLDLTVNGNNLGVISKGVVKNIEVSKNGVRTGDSWVTRFE